MEITIKGSLEEIKELLQVTEGSKEQDVDLISILKGENSESIDERIEAALKLFHNVV